MLRARYWQFNSYQPTSPKRFMPDQDCRVIWVGSGKLKEPVMLHSEGRGVCISVWCMCCRDNSPMAARWGNRNIPLHHSSAATSTVTKIITVYMQPISKQQHPLQSSQEPIWSTVCRVLTCQMLANNVVKSSSVLIRKIQEQPQYNYLYFSWITLSSMSSIASVEQSNNDQINPKITSPPNRTCHKSFSMIYS